MSTRFSGGSGRGRGGFDVDEEMHYPTRPVDKDKAEHELVINIKKATSPEESAPKQKHVRSMSWLPMIQTWNSPPVSRVHRLYLGLPLLKLVLDVPSSPTHSIG